MSLINQVLKDLEERHATGVEARGLPSSVRALPRPHRKRGRALVLSALLLLAALGTGSWWFGLRQEATAARPALVAAAASVAPQPPQPTQPLQPPLAGMPASAGGAAAPPAAPPAATPAATGAMSAPVPVAAQRDADEAIAPAVSPPGRPGPEPAAARDTIAATQPIAPAVSPPGRPRPGRAAARDTIAAIQPAAPRAVAPKARPKAKTAESAPVAPATVGPAPAERAETPQGDELVVVEEPAAIDKQMRWGSTQERAESEFRRGLRVYEEGRASEAETAWRGALETDPANAPARYALLGLMLERGQREEAQRLVQEGLIADPTQLKLRMMLARLQLDRGAQAEALRTLVVGLSDAQVGAEYLTTTAAVMARAGRNRDAADLYQRALDQAPGNPVWYMGLGLALRADRRPAEALAAFQRAREPKALAPELQAFVERQVRELQ